MINYSIISQEIKQEFEFLSGININEIYKSKYARKLLEYNLIDAKRTNIHKLATNYENQRNRKRSSSYTGVRFDKKMNAYQAYVYFKKNQLGYEHRRIALHIGYFKNEIEAAEAYNKQAEIIFGYDAMLNKIKFPHNFKRLGKILHNKSSKYKGVRFHNVTKTFQAIIRKDSKIYSLGYHPNELEAAIAYNKKAIELYGESTRKLNIIK